MSQKFKRRRTGDYTTHCAFLGLASLPRDALYQLLTNLVPTDWLRLSRTSKACQQGIRIILPMRTLWLSWHIQVGTHSFSFNPPNPVWNVPGNSRIVWSRLQQVPINCLSVSFGNLLGNIPSGNLVQTLQELSIVWDCWSIRSHAKVAIGQLANLKLLSLLSLELRPDQWRDLAGQLPDMPHLHTLIIDNTGTIPDTVLQDMGQLSCLRTLVLKSCNWLTDNAVSSWTALTNLEALDLSFCCFLTAACLPLIGQLSNTAEDRISCRL